MASRFLDLGYDVLEGLIDPGQIAFARKAMDFSHANGRMQRATKPSTEFGWEEYGPVAGEVLLRHCLPRIAAIAGEELLPTYAFWRIYEAGAELLVHRDRPSCEISATLMIAAEPEEQGWPIWVRDLEGTEVPVSLRPGSAVVYQGRKVYHWRERYAGQKHYQVFLHYVRKNGKYADFAHDGRPALNA